MGGRASDGVRRRSGHDDRAGCIDIRACCRCTCDRTGTDDRGVGRCGAKVGDIRSLIEDMVSLIESCTVDRTVADDRGVWNVGDAIGDGRPGIDDRETTIGYQWSKSRIGDRSTSNGW